MDGRSDHVMLAAVPDAHFSAADRFGGKVGEQFKLDGRLAAVGAADKRRMDDDFAGFFAKIRMKQLLDHKR